MKEEKRNKRTRKKVMAETISMMIDQTTTQRLIHLQQFVRWLVGSSTGPNAVTYVHWQ